ncbi:ribosome small subunit-dependent GTPase A [Silvimonas amylolytica]|uniref:Small ribosomal subunit biogenesis GTPase RsgA n=1 Tax=Silvimonas amylolytica TaxID=449663 RepID=A0ABQ2PHT1_9NEIS|nr:ribosome small subunit-dependent GTPase A [Silvimonas amylolytica]GGP24941.1 putative ribosome biogenesis GTPase RsgA [Silvimonas amylolytica]
MLEVAFDYPQLQLIGLNQTVVNLLYTLDEQPTQPAALMRVVEIQRDCVTLHDGNMEHAARVLPWLIESLHAHASALAVGDWVITQTNDLGEHWVGQQLPPISHLARRANDGRRQPLASNVDTALLVMGLDLDFNPRRLERYIAFTRAAGINAVAVLTKADISPDAGEKLAELQARLPADIPILAINGLEEATCLTLMPWLAAGQTLVVLGSSGAGKSTLTNTLSQSDDQATGGVRKGDGRGRHTTTARSLHRLPGGACIIDTPGLRTWRPDTDEAGINAGFEDIDQLAAHCHFRDCQHRDEPGCAVREAIAPDRLRNYHKLIREARRGQQTALERKAETARWKAIGKAGTARHREKRGG